MVFCTHGTRNSLRDGGQCACVHNKGIPVVQLFPVPVFVHSFRTDGLYVRDSRRGRMAHVLHRSSHVSSCCSSLRWAAAIIHISKTRTKLISTTGAVCGCWPSGPSHAPMWLSIGRHTQRKTAMSRHIPVHKRFMWRRATTFHVATSRSNIKARTIMFFFNGIPAPLHPAYCPAQSSVSCLIFQRLWVSITHILHVLFWRANNPDILTRLL